MRRIIFSPRAKALLFGGADAPHLSGEVKFYQKADHVLIVAEINGLPTNESGFYGFHIHEGNSCSGSGFPDTKSHYNPRSSSHPSHAGDLPPLLYCKGSAYLCVESDRFTVEEIIGRTLVIHSSPDDFTTQPSGNAGVKIACGIIEQF